ALGQLGEFGQSRRPHQLDELGTPTHLTATSNPEELSKPGRPSKPSQPGESNGEVLARRTRHVVTEIARVTDAVAALKAGDLAELGRLFDTSHTSLRDDFEVSCAELDVSVDAARSAGALGARMTGGGFGGSSIALIPATSVEKVSGVIRAAFAESGFREPTSFAVTAGPPARRDA
ncbi:MAG: hypothetical protein ACRCYX_00625, partial [Dermatophilaceae bacterium]